MQEHVRKGAGFDWALGVWSRRKWLAILAFAGPISAALSLVNFLPNVYRSTATVLVERQQVPETFVRSTVTSELETRLRSVSEQILNRSRLENLVARFDLYPDLRTQASPQELIMRLRGDIQLEFKGADQWPEPKGADPRLEPREDRQAWMFRPPTVALTINYVGRDPETVASVTNTLASFFVEESLKARNLQATGTAEFLRGQLQEVKQRLDEQERQVNEFKTRYMGELPQQMEANLASLQQLNGQLQVNSENQTRAMQRREALAKQLAEDRIAKLKHDLTELRTRYSEKYPDVIQLKGEILALERQFMEMKQDGKPDAEPAANPDVLRLKDALREAEAEMDVLKAEEKSLRQAIATYRRRVENTPQREREYQKLSRDYEMTKELDNSMSKRYEEAQLAESMEQYQKGEQFRILDPAVASKQPAAPNRFRLLVMGLLLSLAMAAGSVALAERLDTSFHSVDALRAFTTVPVLVSIPKIVTEAGIRRRQSRVRLVAASAMLGLALMVGSAYFIARGNEQLVLMLHKRWP